MERKKLFKENPFKKKLKVNHLLEVAGYNFDQRTAIRHVLMYAAILSLGIFIAINIATLWQPVTFGYRIIVLLAMIFVGYPATVMIMGLLFFIYTDVRIADRKNSIEKVLPEFLHLTSANIRSGMPIDRALWSAIRPRFGVLAREVQTVAKQNMVGEELERALEAFSKKYDSKILKRAMSLLIEGLEAGSEIGELLEKIALNIQDIQTRRESMAANVMTYVIFIGFAVLIAAPILFGISIQLLRIVHAVSGSLGPSSGAGIGGVSISLSTDAVKESDFFVFALCTLTLTSIMSSFIITAIKSGDTSDAVKLIPLYIACTTALFFISQWVLGAMFGSVI